MIAVEELMRFPVFQLTAASFDVRGFIHQRSSLSTSANIA